VAPFQIPPPVYIPYPVYSPIVHPIYGEPRWVPTEYIWCGTTTPDPEMLARFHAGKNAADYSTIYYDGNSYRAGIQ
jgi:hypothetical protein